MHALALALLLLTGQPETPPDVWPQWRGPTGDSVAPGGDLPLQWGKSENILWKVALPGWATSTPAVWKDAVFVTSQEDDRLLLLRLDRDTGKIVWRREVGKGTPRREGPLGHGRFHNEHNMATPSPVTDGERVCVHYGNGDLACYDFAGKKLWSHNLTERFGPYTIWWGHANSPTLVGDLLVSACMQDPKDGGKSYLVAHDKRTGKERWAVARDTGAKEEWADSYTTPLLHRANGRDELIVLGGNVLDAYDPATGKQLWRSGVFKGNRVIPGPTAADGVVYAVQGMRGPLFAIKTGGQGDVTDSRLLWKYTGGTPDSASPVVANGLVFLATNPGAAICLDAKTGQELWKERLSEGFRATPLVAGNRVYFVGKDGRTTVVEASREFKRLASSDLGEEIIASPAVAGGDLYIRTKEHLYCIGKSAKGR